MTPNQHLMHHYGTRAIWEGREKLAYPAVNGQDLKVLGVLAGLGLVGYGLARHAGKRETAHAHAINEFAQAQERERMGLYLAGLRGEEVSSPQGAFMVQQNARNAYDDALALKYASAIGSLMAKEALQVPNLSAMMSGAKGFAQQGLKRVEEGAMKLRGAFKAPSGTGTAIMPAAPRGALHAPTTGPTGTLLTKAPPTGAMVATPTAAAGPGKAIVKAAPAQVVKAPANAPTPAQPMPGTKIVDRYQPPPPPPAAPAPGTPPGVSPDESSRRGARRITHLGLAAAGVAGTAAAGYAGLKGMEGARDYMMQPTYASNTWGGQGSLQTGAGSY